MLYAIDAIPCRCGATVARCREVIFRGLYRMSLRTGKLGRPNWNGSEEVAWQPVPMPRPREDADEVFQGSKCRVIRAGA